MGAVSVVSGGSVLFGPQAAREAAGEYVPFVVWFNFCSGFLYLAAGVGLFAWKRWGARLAAVLAVAIAAVGLAFAAHIALGGAYEIRTVAAMSVRALLWFAVAVAACRAFACLQRQPLAA
jgi:hypothetical protein